MRPRYSSAPPSTPRGARHGARYPWPRPRRPGPAGRQAHYTPAGEGHDRPALRPRSSCSASARSRRLDPRARGGHRRDDEGAGGAPPARPARTARVRRGDGRARMSVMPATCRSSPATAWIPTDEPGTATRSSRCSRESGAGRRPPRRRAGGATLVLGGDCTVHPAVLGALRDVHAGARVGLVWFDAHGDSHTTDTTPSGNVWGMAVALARVDVGDGGLVAASGGGVAADEDCALLGGQALEAEEAFMLTSSGVAHFGSGMLATPAGMAAFEAWSSVVGQRVDGFYVAFDVDALDSSADCGDPARARRTLARDGVRRRSCPRRHRARARDRVHHDQPRQRGRGSHRPMPWRHSRSRRSAATVARVAASGEPSARHPAMVSGRASASGTPRSSPRADPCLGSR